MHSNRRIELMRITGATLMVVALLVVAPQSAGAQSEQAQKAPPNLQELREKLLLLEQSMQELKGQINAAEQSHKTSGAPINGTPGKVGGEYPNDKPLKSPGGPTNEGNWDLALGSPASAGAGKTPEKVTPKPAQNTESTFEVYGFAMLDMGYQFKQAHPDWFDTLRPTKLPSFEDEFAPDGKWFTGVRQTRMGVKSNIATSIGELKTIFEFELFGTGVDAGQTTFRLRHAWGELGQFGAGQYWSVFVDPDSFPNTIEYWGPNGLSWFRNVHFRWMPLKGRNALTIGIERPGAAVDQGVFTDRIELQGVKGKFDTPDLTANARFTRDWGHVQIGGLLKKMKWVDLNNDQFDLGGSDVGWGVAVSSAPKFSKNNVGRFQILYGEGVQNYMNDAPTDVGIAVSDSTDPRRPIKGVALPLFGMSAYLDHTWSKKFSSAIGYSLVSIENSNRQAANAFHRGHYFSTNLLYYPVEKVTIGSEFLWGQRTNWHDGFSSDDYRIQFSFKYNFSKVWAF